jgi:hypothetical protein
LSTEFFFDNLIAEFDTLVTDVNRCWTRNQLSHLALAFAAKGALQQFAGLAQCHAKTLYPDADFLREVERLFSPCEKSAPGR